MLETPGPEGGAALGLEVQQRKAVGSVGSRARGPPLFGKWGFGYRRRENSVGGDHLSKSKYLAAKQCQKRLWLGCFAPQVATPPDPALQARLAAGTEIGKMARLLFPRGVLVEEEAFRHEEAVRRTGRLIRDPAVSAIFEAAFQHEEVRIRVDILERLQGGSWGVREVKSSTAVSDVHIDDLAIQWFVLTGAGVHLESAEIVCVNQNYVRGQGEVKWAEFFCRHDVTARVNQRLSEVPGLVKRFHGVLALSQPPPVEPWAQCFSPYECEFFEHCSRDEPDDWILYLPRLPEAKRARLRDAGIERISDIPDDFPLCPVQRRIREAVRCGREVREPGLAEALSGFGPPADYLDFETMNPAIPLYAGTRPYERIPFQWSLHRVGSEGRVSHQEFLADGRGDPRVPFAQTLLRALEETDNPVVVYSSFEAATLACLAKLLPELAGRLERASSRLKDLLPVVKKHLYHPAFRFSFSIKNVAPALSPGFCYDDLGAVAAGDRASALFVALARGELASEEELRARRELLEYCRRDTQALLELHRALIQRAER